MRKGTSSHRQIILLLASLLLAIGLNAIPARAQELNFNDIDTYISRLMQQYQVPGTAIALVKDGSIIYEKGYGVRNIFTREPVTQNTVFAIGSISKSFTSLAIGQLVDEGKLRLDDPITNYLPTFKLTDAQATKTLTVRELLDQTSGLPRMDDLWWPGAPANRQQIVNALMTVKLTAEPGQLFQYSNQNYVLLGYLIEQVTHQTWEDYVEEHILKPLGMTSASFNVVDMQKQPDYAMPHVLDDQRGLTSVFFFPNDVQWLTTHGPAISINANVDDMARYVEFQLGDGTYGGQRLLSQAMLDEAHRPEVALSPITPLVTDEGYGMGWFTETYRNYSLVEHSGDVKGFASNITLVPSQKVGVVLLTNSQTVESYRQAIRLRMIEFLLGLNSEQDIAKTLDNASGLTELKQALDASHSFMLDPKILAQLPGDYDGLLGRTHIEIDNGKLFARRAGWIVLYEVVPFAPHKLLFSPGSISDALLLNYKFDAQGKIVFYLNQTQVLKNIHSCRTS